MAVVTERIEERQARWRGFAATPQVTSLVILVVVLVGFSLANPNFMSPRNISNMLAYLPELGIMALAMTLLLTAGEFDLSVGAVFALGPVIVMLLVQQGGLDLGVALLIGLVVCIAIGAINGFIVTKVGISSFLVTLSMLMIVRGVALYITQGFPLRSWDQPSFLVSLLAGTVEVGPFRLYVSLLWFVGLILLSAYILNWSKLGNWISAIGSNRNAALARGVPADAVKIGLFIAAAVLSGLAGMISAFRISAASPVAGTGYELEVIAMVVVGGTALTGGYGTILGTVAGALMLRAIRNGIVLVGVPGLAFNIFVGAIILLMLILHAMISRGEARR